jgi:hypothetical protein
VASEFLRVSDLMALPTSRRSGLLWRHDLGRKYVFNHLIHHPLQQKPWWRITLKLLIAGAALGTNERKLNVEMEGEGFPRGLWVSLRLFREISFYSRLS